MLKRLKKISSKRIFENPFWEYYLDKYKMPNGIINEYHYVNSRGATLIIPIDANGKIVWLKQYRYLNQKESIELPGGGIKIGYEPLQNAIEELAEEAGIKAETIELIGSFNPFNGVTNEICYVYCARNLVFCKPKPEQSEEFEQLLLSENNIINKIKTGEIWDGMSLAAWAIYQNLKN